MHIIVYKNVFFSRIAKSKTMNQPFNLIEPVVILSGLLKLKLSTSLVWNEIISEEYL